MIFPEIYNLAHSSSIIGPIEVSIAVGPPVQLVPINLARAGLLVCTTGSNIARIGPVARPTGGGGIVLAPNQDALMLWYTTHGSLVTAAWFAWVGATPATLVVWQVIAIDSVSG